MIKEFEIKDILNAVNDIFELERKKIKYTVRKKVFKDKAHNLPNNQGVKSNKSEILVLDEMIE